MPRHFFLRDRANFPVACIASAIFTQGVMTDGPLEPDSTIVFALSIHNPADTYNRDRARTIALARLSKGKSRECLPKPNVKANILSSIIGAYEYRTGEGYVRLVDAAKHRLSILEAKARVEAATGRTIGNDGPARDHCAADTIAEEMAETINRTDEGDTFAAAVADMHDSQELADPEAFDRVEQPISVDEQSASIIDSSPDPDPDEPYPGATAERATRLAMDDDPICDECGLPDSAHGDDFLNDPPKADGLTGTLIEAVCAEHPPEAEKPWSFADAPIVGDTDYDTRRRNEL